MPIATRQAADTPRALRAGPHSLQQQPYFDFEFDEGEAAALPPASLDVAQCEAMMLEPTQQALELTVNSASSDDEQPQSTGKRKRGAAAEASGRNGARGLRRSVSFSTSSLIRMTEIVAESSSPVPVEHKTDHEARMRAEDGPRPAATLLDDLIVVRALSLMHRRAGLLSLDLERQNASGNPATWRASCFSIPLAATGQLVPPLSWRVSVQAFFERGAINGPDDVGLHLETSFPGRSGELPAVASRYVRGNKRKPCKPSLVPRPGSHRCAGCQSAGLRQLSPSWIAMGAS